MAETERRFEKDVPVYHHPDSGKVLVPADDLTHALRTMAAGLREQEAQGAQFVGSAIADRLADQFAQVVLDAKAEVV